MKTIAFVPPLTNVGAPAFFWTLFRDLAAQGFPVTPRLPAEWLPPDSALWGKNPDGLPIELFDEHTPENYAAVVFFISPTWADVARVIRLREKFIVRGGPTQAWCSVQLNRGLPNGVDLAPLEKELRLLPFAVPYHFDLWLNAQKEGRAVEKSNTPLIATELATFFRQLPQAQDNSTAEHLQTLEIRIRTEVIRRSAAENVAPTELIDRVMAGELLEEKKTMPDETIKELRRRVLDHVLGLGRIEEFFRDSSVNEIMVNGTSALFIERDGNIESAPALSVDEVQWVVDRISGVAGRRLDAGRPYCDVRLKDGSRVHIALPPIAVEGPYITVRRFRSAIATMDDLLKRGTLNPEQAEHLRLSVEARKNILIAGNTGSGKTTLLNILSAWIPDQERIVTIEDAAELRLQNTHVVRLEARPANAEGSGEITIHELVINALRMRPDRLIIGECRGPEAIPMLQAMNTGHDGSMTTLHANSAQDALERLESMVLIGAPRWPTEIVRRQITTALDVVVYLKREGARRLLTDIVDLS
jgi:Flp pilus assembly CpaF family ATPase